MEIDDKELVRRCLAGESSAQYAFVQRYQGLVFGVCLRMLGDAHEAEDVAQEVFIRALRNLKQWDASRPMRPWLLTIASNRCRTFLTRSKRRPLASEFSDDVVDTRHSEATSNELKTEIDEALKQLRPDYTKVFLLFHEQGLSYEEMSEITARPIGTLKTWLHRARTELLEILKQRGMVPEEDDELRRD